MEKEETKDPVDQSESTSGESDQATTNQEDRVDYASYQKLLKEKKAMQERAKEAEQLRQQLKEKEEAELEKQGKLDELLQRQREETQKYKQELETHQQKYAWKTLTSKIELKARELGCKDPSKLIRLMDDDQLKSIQVGEDFSIDGESLDKVLEQAKQENDFLFGDSNKKFVNGNPSKEPKKAAKSTDEVYEAYINTLK